MKGDFTRFTFEPRKRYTSVLMQQGRLQLDADWNEQISIQNYLQQRQAQDMIGEAAGTPATESGFQILPTPHPKVKTPPTPQIVLTGEDLSIQFGRFYINGILCDFPVTSTFKALQINDRSARLFFTAMDGQRFQVGEWFALQPKGELFKITAIDQEQRLLTFDRDLPTTSTLEFRRITTYKTQIDYPAPATIETGNYLVYLDVWQRHITAIDDPELREVALNVPDTATRIKTLWQVKLLPIKTAPTDNTMESVERLSEWSDLIRPRQVELIVSTDLQPDKPGITNNQGNYLGVENRLYRVEIHEGGLLGKASFKWSRDNGSTVSAIASISGNVIKLKNTIQEAYKLFKQSPEDQPWVEVLTEEQELNNQPGILVQIIATKPPNQLIFETSQIRGGTLPQTNGQPLKVRRWDHMQDAVLMTSDQWIFLEDGIKIKFQTPARNGSDQSDRYETGDYWLIPARNIDRSVQWKKDDQGLFLPQQPAGIQHQYGFLAAVHYGVQEFSPLLEQSWEKSDLRIQFLPLINRFQLGEGSLGVGIKPPWAKLHVKGAEVRSGKEARLTSSTNPTELVLSSPKNDFRLYAGYTLILNSETRVVTGIDPTDRTRITINNPFSQLLNLEPFEYQEPVFRLTTQTSTPDQPEVFMTPTGRIGLGTQNPQAQFHLKQLQNLDNLPIVRFETTTRLGLLIDSQGNTGIGIEPTDAKLQVNGALKLGSASQHLIINRDAQQVQFRTLPQATYSFDQSVTIESGMLKVNSGTIAAGSNASLIFQTADGDRLGILPDGTINVGNAAQSSTLKVFGKVGIGSNVALAEVPNDGLLLQGKLLARSLVSIGTDVSPANLQVRGHIEIGSATNPLSVVVNNSKTEFLGTSNYEFSDRLTIRKGGCKIAGGLDLMSGNLSIEDMNIVVNTAKTEFSGKSNYEFSDRVTVRQGGCEIAGGLNVTSGDLSIEDMSIVVNTAKTEFLGKSNYEFSDRVTIRQGGCAIAGGLDLTSGNFSIADMNIVVNDTKTEFLGTKNYEFSDRVTVRQGGCKIAGGLNVTSGDLSIEGMNVIVNDTKTEFSGKNSYEFSNRLTVRQGGCEIAGGLNVTSGDLSIANNRIHFSTDQAIQSSATTGLSIVTADTDRLTIAPTGTIIAQVPQTFFGIAGQAIVGQTFVANATTATNGLLVEGHLGIGTSRPNAKLEVDGTTGNSQDFGLRIISNNHNLLSVQNQGIVGIGVGDAIATALDSRLKVHGKVAIGKDILGNPDAIPDNGLLVQGDIRAESRIAIAAENDPIPDDVKLFVVGNTEIHGKISADDFTTGLFKQLSSRSLKDHINPLSSQATNQLLQNLNPVTYVYRSDAQQQLHFGFIAEDVPNLLAAPDRNAIHPFDIVAVLTKAVQDQQLVITSLHRTVQSQQKTIALMNDRLDILETTK